MNKHRKNIIALTLVIGVVSCNVNDDNYSAISYSNDDIILFDNHNSNYDDQRIMDFEGFLEIEEAIKIARMAEKLYGKVQTRNVEVRNVKDVSVINNDLGNPIMYSVNYTDSMGFTLISATKKYYPIIAEFEHGVFDEGIEETGFSILMDEYKQDIAYCSTLPEDSLAIFNRAWSRFINKEEQSKQLLNTRTEGDLISVLAAAFSEWTSAGYVYESLTGCPDGLPQSEYARFCALAEALTNPDYSDVYLDYSFVLTPDPNRYESFGPYLSSEWKREDGYNCLTPTDPFGIHYPLGCVTLALGQIMRFHCWPESYFWNSMPYSQATYTTANFLREVGENTNTDYADGSSSHYFDARSALNNYYHYSFDADSLHKAGRVYTSIKNGRPVFMSGLAQDGPGHAWVCDGWRGAPVVDDLYILMVLSQVPPLHFETAGSYDYPVSGYNNEVHMNWGSTSYSNAWCAETYSMQFSYNRKDIYNIRPNE